MMPNEQNPGGLAGASRNQLVGWLLRSNTPSARQTQMRASRFRPPPSAECHLVQPFPEEGAYG